MKYQRQNVYITDEDIPKIRELKKKLEEKGESMSKFFSKCISDYLSGETTVVAQEKGDTVITIRITNK